MKISTLMPTSVGGMKSPAEILIEQKHAEYANAARAYKALYYIIRLVGGLSAGILPFIVSSKPQLTLALSMTIVVCTIVDLVFGVKDKWKLMSRAADLLTVERLKLSGDYEKYKDLVAVLVNTEAAMLDKLVDLETVLQKARDANSAK